MLFLWEVSWIGRVSYRQKPRVERLVQTNDSMVDWNYQKDKDNSWFVRLGANTLYDISGRGAIAPTQGKLVLREPFDAVPKKCLIRKPYSSSRQLLIPNF